MNLKFESYGFEFYWKKYEKGYTKCMCSMLYDICCCYKSTYLHSYIIQGYINMEETYNNNNQKKEEKEL